MKNILFFTFSILFFNPIDAQQNMKPKLVVGIVVDQMRYDYLTRYEDRYGEDGFKKLINNGFLLSNAHFSYVPTYTAVGHTSIYTGTTPDHHGIIGNNWYDKFLKQFIYCVDDSNFNSVGVKGKSGQKSPFRLYTTTVTDQLRLSQNMRGKTIGIAIKDRSAILPVGHSATAAYWYEGNSENKWISSSFYLNELPSWVKKFNQNNKADQYLSKPWNTLYDIKTYKNSIADNNDFEIPFNGKTTPTFPYDLSVLRLKNWNYNIIKETPFGNTLTLDFAKAAILGENLGKGNDIDFLALSLSSTDYIGHRFGPDAVETEDTYLRLDKDLAAFIAFLDEKVGKGKYTIFLTADHGAVQVPSYLQSLKIPAHYFKSDEFNDFVSKKLNAKYGSNELVENISNYQIFLNKDTLNSLNLSSDEVGNYLVNELINFEGVYKVVTARTLQTTQFTNGILEKIQNGYNQKFSGDVMIVPYPASLTRRPKGTSHGSGFSYDTHVPIIFYGAGIKTGSSSKKYYIKDIAPTISSLLEIEFPNSFTGSIIQESLKAQKD